jgi:hypothetical protein
MDDQRQRGVSPDRTYPLCCLEAEAVAPGDPESTVASDDEGKRDDAMARLLECARSETLLASATTGNEYSRPLLPRRPRRRPDDR